MDQKRILWIVAAVGIFLLVVVGAALILYAPPKQNATQIAKNERIFKKDELSQPNFIESKTPQTNFLHNEGKIPTTVKELTVIAENATIISDKTVDGKTNLQIIPEKKSTPALGQTDEVTFQSIQNDTSKDILSKNENNMPQVGERFPQQVQIEVKPIKIETVAGAKESAVTVVNVAPPQKMPIVEKKEPKPVTKVTPATSAKKETKTESPKPVAKQTAKGTTSSSAPKITPKYWVQAASFTNKKNAEDARKILTQEKIESELFTYTAADGKLYYRVRVGPYSTKSEAEYWRVRISQVEQFSKTSSYVTNSSEPIAKK
ncbi:MAG: hypothetical protein GX220_01090 [Treponema sp.]|nr:hypothetical protein [Treponema sp.]